MRALRRARMVWAGTALVITGGVTAGLVYAQVEVVEKPVHDLQHDVLQLPPAQGQPAVTASSALSGRIVYPVRVPAKGGPQRQPFDLVLRHVTMGKLQTAAGELYRAKPPLADIIYDPQFSPDGRYLAFKAGWPYERQSTYRLYLWDLQTKKLINGPVERLTYPLVYWSPDSNYLAFTRGGNSEGVPLSDDKPLELRIFSLKTSMSHLVAQIPASTTVAWTTRGTLLYAFFPPETTDAVLKAAEANQPQPKSAQRPSIYEIPADGGEPKPVITDAYGNRRYLAMPALAPSPDGKWIAFFGWPDARGQAGEQREPATNPGGDKRTTSQFPDKDKTKVEFPGLYLLDRANNKRVLVGSFSASSLDFLRWTADSHHLLLIRTKYQSEGAKGIGEARIKTVDVGTLTAKDLAVLHTQDVLYAGWADTTPEFEPLQVSNNSRFLLLKVSRATARQTMTYTTTTSLQAVDLQNGAVSTLAQTVDFMGNSMGLDWHEDSLDATPAAPNPAAPQNTSPAK